MKKVLKIFLFMFVFLQVAGFVFLIDEVKEIEERKEKEKSPEGRFQLKIEDFEKRHKRLASLPPRSFKNENGIDVSLYPDDYYDKTQQLYREEIAFIVEQYGEDATAKVVFLISQIPVTGQYFIGKIEAYYTELRSPGAYTYYPEAFDAVCAQIAHKTMNSICDYALDLAIGYGYKQMAQSIIRCYKPDIRITKTKDYLTSWTDEYKVSTTYQSRDNAKARIADL